MPRDGSSVFSLPAGTTAAPNTTIQSAPYNAALADIVQDLNTDRPVAAGGTGASTPELARANLGVTLQASASDNTLGRVLTNGAHGLGRNAPERSTADALDELARTTWNYIATENVATVGGPTGAPAGIVWTGTAAGGRYQIYYPLDNDNTSPWRRASADGVTYGDWVRDIAFGGTTAERWERRASGRMDIMLTGVTLVFNAATSLKYDWTFPVAFSAVPHITACFQNAGSHYTGLAAGDLGIVSAAGTGAAVTVLVRCITGATAFASGDIVTNVTLRATGFWE